jgi:hypothetical protein
MAEPAIIRHGWLLKAGARGPGRQWRRVWAFLTAERLYYSSRESAATGAAKNEVACRYLPLDRLPVRPRPRGYDPQPGVTRVDARQVGAAGAFAVACGGTSHLFAAPGAAEAVAWVAAIERAWLRCATHGAHTLALGRGAAGDGAGVEAQLLGPLERLLGVLPPPPAWPLEEPASATRVAKPPAAAAAAAPPRAKARRPASLAAPPPVDPVPPLPEAPSRWYSLTLRMGDAPGAGTAAAVRVRLCGDAGASARVALPAARGDFERGAKAVFRLRLPPLGVLRALEVTTVPARGAPGPPSGWLLRGAEVLDEATGAVARFPCGAWIGRRASGRRDRPAEATLATAAADAQPDVQRVEAPRRAAALSAAPQRKEPAASIPAPPRRPQAAAQAAAAQAAARAAWSQTPPLPPARAAGVQTSRPASPAPARAPPPPEEEAILAYKGGGALAAAAARRPLSAAEKLSPAPPPPADEARRSSTHTQTSPPAAPTPGDASPAAAPPLPPPASVNVLTLTPPSPHYSLPAAPAAAEAEYVATLYTGDAPGAGTRLPALLELRGAGGARSGWVPLPNDLSSFARGAADAYAFAAPGVGEPAELAVELAASGDLGARWLLEAAEVLAAGAARPALFRPRGGAAAWLDASTGFSAVLARVEAPPPAAREVEAAFADAGGEEAAAVAATEAPQVQTFETFATLAPPPAAEATNSPPPAAGAAPPAPPARPDARGAQRGYRVVVHNAQRLGAGTAAAPFLELVGDRGSSGALWLDRRARGAFSAGAAHAVDLPDLPPLGELAGARVGTDGAGGLFPCRAGWTVALVEVIHLTTGRVRVLDGRRVDARCRFAAWLPARPGDARGGAGGAAGAWAGYP